ncbi:hypothetical protein ABH935_003377 [Catenulispora sp. GAS73]|uniref:hypothetical protein n=1 Tax=Catenulispora sp. GAS73 TaxID=3156269 RepID=UPI0035163982
MTILNGGAAVVRKRLVRRRRPSARTFRRSGNLGLESCGLQVPVGLAAKSPTLLAVAVEDLCWRLEMDAWRSRRPRPWQLRRRAAWRAERTAFTAREQGLRAVANQELADL